MAQVEPPGKARKRCIFAAVGDVHGQFSKMVRSIREWEQANGGDNDGINTVSFVLQVGDMEPHRHEHDVTGMAMPSKHRSLGDFHKVVSGEIVLRWPTYFIGGNHEPWEFLEAHEGAGFDISPLVPNLHFLGRASVTTIGPL
jgi:lariat debranching enzyme